MHVWLYLHGIEDALCHWRTHSSSILITPKENLRIRPLPVLPVFSPALPPLKQTVSLISPLICEKHLHSCNLRGNYIFIRRVKAFGQLENGSILLCNLSGFENLSCWQPPTELSLGFVIGHRTKTSNWHEYMYSLVCIRLCFPLPDFCFKLPCEICGVAKTR